MLFIFRGRKTSITLTKTDVGGRHGARTASASPSLCLASTHSFSVAKMATALAPAAQLSDAEKKQKALVEYRRRLLEKKELQAKVKQSMYPSALTFLVTMPLVRDGKKDLIKLYDRTEEDLKALQSVGQIIGEVLRQLDEERCALHPCLRESEPFQLL